MPRPDRDRSEFPMDDDDVRVNLDERWVRRLTALPESGMGYQRVDVRLADRRELKDVLVFNAEEIELPDRYARVGIADLRPDSAQPSHS
jgi:hypothetical protein